MNRRNLIACFLLIVKSTSAIGANTFIGLGVEGLVNGLSDDGTVAVVRGANNLRWTLSGGIESLGPPPLGSSYGPYGISADGRVIVGNYGPVASLWTESAGWQTLVPPEEDDLSLSFAQDVSADGAVVVGFKLYPEERAGAFRWTEQTGAVWLRQAGRQDRAAAVTPEGGVVVGTLGYGELRSAPFRWTEETGLVPLGLPPNASGATATDVSADGRVIVGFYRNPSNTDTAFYWTQETGYLDLGFRRARAVSADGSIVVGTGYWDAVNGGRPLRDVFVNEFNLGPELTGWGELFGWAITPDGHAIGGYGYNPDGILEAFVAYIPKLYGDFDGNRLLDASDIDSLSAQVLAELHTAAFDMDGNGLVEGRDREIWVVNVAQTYFGDSNLNRAVEFGDFVSLANHFGEPGGWAQGDFDGSGVVQFPDFVLLADNFGKSATTAAVPEPGANFLVMVGLIGLAKRKSRPRGRHAT